MKNGKGKEYDENGILKFEGEYLNGLKNGKGKVFYVEGEFHILNKDIKNDIYLDKKIIFECEYLNGLRNGIGKYYNKNGMLLFEIKFLNDKKFGKVKIYDENGNLKKEV